MIGKLFILNLRSLAATIIKPDRKGGGDSTKTAMFVLIAAVLAGAAFMMFSLMFETLLEPLFGAGIGWMYFTLLGVSAFAMCVVGTVFSATSQIFSARDNERLLAMPINPSAILISRLLVIIAGEYAFTTLIALSAFVPWVRGGYATAAGMLIFFLVNLLLPLMALAVTLLLAWVLGSVTSRLKHKNIVSFVIGIVFLAAYFYGVSNLQRYLVKLLMNGSAIAEAFRKSLPPFYSFGKSIAEASVTDTFLFMLWALVPFAITVLLLRTNYMRILMARRGAAKTVYREKASKERGALWALTKKDLLHCLNKPAIILNASLGSLFMLIVAVMLVVRKAALFSYIDQIAPMLGELPLVPLMAIMLMVLGSLNNLSSSLISLEGSNLWIAKSIPAPTGTVMLSKICAHLAMCGLPCLVASICGAAVLADSLADKAALILVPQAWCAFTATAGLAINLNIPKLDWTNEVSAVKQGMSAIVAMFGAIGALAVFGLAWVFAFRQFLSISAYLWCTGAAFALGSALIFAWLAVPGAKKFARL
jgi:ABC-2 type transport system permease protein